MSQPHANAVPTGAQPLPQVRGVGNLIKLVRRGNYETLTHLAQAHGGRLCELRIGKIGVIPIVRPEHAQHVLVDGRGIYQKLAEIEPLRLLVGHGLFSSEGELWASQRRLMQPHFTPKAVLRYGGAIEGAIAATLARWEGAPTIEAMGESMRLAMDVIGRSMFGIAEISEAGPLGAAIGESLNHASRRLYQLLTPPLWVPTPANRRFIAARRHVDAFIYDVIRRRRARPPAEADVDLLDVLIAARDAESGRTMSDEQLRDELMTVFIAGHETTAVTLTWALILLSRHPEVADRIAAEAAALTRAIPGPEDIPRLPYTRQVIDEALRLYPAVWALPRTAARADVLDGFAIREGSIVSILVHVLHRQSDLWPVPDRFDPERFSPANTAGRHRHAYMPFGAGHRICIGMHLALMELVMALAAIVRRYRLTVSGPPITHTGLSTLRPSGPVWMRLERRSGSAG